MDYFSVIIIYLCLWIYYTIIANIKYEHLKHVEKRRTISSSESYDSNYEPIELANSKKRSRIVSVFNLYATYENREKAVTAIRLENTWNKGGIRDSKEGVKEAYQCKYSKCKN